MSKSWYFCMGEDPNNVNSYERITVQHNFLCGEKISVILADGEQLHPNAPFSENMLLYINNAIKTGQIQPEHPILSKKYVYLKD